MSGASTGAWLPPRRGGGGTRVRLFALPYAGGDTSIFAPWAEHLPHEIELCPVQLPGRGRRALEPAYAEIGPLVRALADALAPAFDAPFALFGHSMGALVGFELARELRRRGQPAPCQLLVAGRHAPQLPPRYGPLSHLPDDELLAQLHRRYGYAAPAPAPAPDDAGQLGDLLDLMRPTVRADLRVSEGYVYADEPPLDCPITAFGGLADPTVTREELDAWRHQTMGPFRTRMLPGGHFFLESEAEVRFLVRFLVDSVRSALERRSP